MSTTCDRIFLGGLILLIVATPFAIGSAPPPAFSAMEAAIFALVIVWMVKIIGDRRAASGVSGADRLTPNPSPLTSSGSPDTQKPKTQSLIANSHALPLALFVGLILFQLVPLPPPLLRLISPSTFEFYSRIFAGWPERAPYGDLAVGGVGNQGLGAGGDPNAKSEIRNSQSEITPTPNTEHPTQNLIPKTKDLSLTATWLPLTVAPYLTKIDLLKLLAYSALFFLVLFYPYGEAWERSNNESSPLGKRPPDERLLRRIVWAVLGSGFLVGFVGFVQRFTWNGKVLWFYEPYSTTPAAAGAVTRASGPFVNPDHFANYVALILPLALACALFCTSLADKDRQPMLRIGGAATAILLFTGILLSLSRGAMAAVCMSIAVLLLLLPWGAKKTRGGKSVLFRGIAVARAGAMVFCVLLIVALYFAGPSGREQVDARLAGGLVDEVSLGGRSQIWRDSPKLIADYPLFGVGLGSWPEVFMHYRSDPWGLNFFREAHNDYIQLISEAGFVGFALFAWFAALHGRRLLAGMHSVTTRYRPLIAAMVAGFAGMALHEWFDFNLRIPANAFLFVLLVALALRAVSSAALRSTGREQRAGGSEQGAGSTEQGVPSGAPESNALANQHTESASDSGSLLCALSTWLRALSPVLLAPRSLLKPNTQYPIPAAAALSPWRFAVSSGSMHHAPSSSPSASWIGKLAMRNPRSGLRNSALGARLTPYALPLAPYGVIVLCIVLAWQALEQNPIPYPFNLGEADSLAEAKENVLIFPTNALYHDTVLKFLGDPAPLAWQLRQLSAALWLEPANPYFRDRYAEALLQSGRPKEALREMTLAVYNAPDFSVHPYLNQDALAKLPAEQQQAIEEGFRRAAARRSPGAVIGLGEFYAGVGRFAEQAALFEQAAAGEKDGGKRVDLALRAGAAYAKAENLPKAERILSDAIANNRRDSRPYEYMIREIYGARKDLLGAKQILSEGVRNGAPALALHLALAEAARKANDADEVANALAAAKSAVIEAAKESYPFDLYIQLADGAGRVGEHDQELTAMLAALELQPTDSEVLSRIANIYLSQKNYDRAVMYLEKLAQTDYNSGSVAFRLAQAEEARYRYAAAGRAYARALELDPDNKNYKTAYAAFKQKVSENAIQEDAKGKEPGAGRR